MNTFLLFVIVVLLIVIIHEMKKGSDDTKKAKPSYQKILPEYMKKMCEITVKEPLPSIDIMYSVKGILADADEEWVMIEVEDKKKKMQKLFRIDNISSIKEVL